MNYKPLSPGDQQAITDLFISVFSESEGEDEGKLLGNLVAELAAKADDETIISFGSYENDSLTGAIFFTRLQFSDPALCYMLAPVAVSTGYQGQGIGQALIRHGLQELKKRSVDIAVTYGDPAFYSKTGFQALSEEVIQAPLPLSMPFGWLGQSLTQAPIPTIKERPVCVAPFNDPAYW